MLDTSRGANCWSENLSSAEAALVQTIEREVEVSSESRTSLTEISDWIERKSRLEYLDARRGAFMLGALSAFDARPIVVGRKAIDLMAKIIERKDEVMFLLKALPRNERGRR